MHQSKSDENINFFNEKNKSKNNITIISKNHEILTKINFIKLNPNDDKIFSLKRKSKNSKKNEKSNNS